jgi:antirestriction protein
MTDTTRRICIQNWATYNEGRLDGRWYDLEDYADLEALEAAVKANNRADAEEFMLADFEGFPDGLITENTHYSKALEISQQLDDVDDMAVLLAYIDAVGIHYAELPELIEQAEGRHQGTADNEKEFAEEYAAQAGYIPQDSFPSDSPFRYIDWQWYWDGQLRFSFVTGNDSEGNLHFFTND